jgi:hypothetical protein
MSQCTAKSKRSGERCRRAATSGRTVCRMHGGKSPSGIASATYKTGRYGRAVPLRLLERMREALGDDELLSLHDDIALIDVRIADLLSRVDRGESGDVWTALQLAYRGLRAAGQAADLNRINLALTAIGDLITRGYADYVSWQAVGAALEQRRKLVESERKRIVALQQTISAAQASALMQALLDSVKANVKDKAALAAIQATFRRLMGD